MRKSIFVLFILTSIVASKALGINVTCQFELIRDDCKIRNLKIEDGNQEVSEILLENKIRREVTQMVHTVQIICGAVYGNELNYLPKGLFKHFKSRAYIPKLRNFIVHKCYDITSLSGYEFDDATSLTNLTVTKTGLEAIADETFGKLLKLYYLDLSENQLRSFSDKVFMGLRRLIHLDLSHNKLNRLQGNLFEGNQMLFSLNLEGNQLNFIGKELLSTLKTIQMVYLQKNTCISYNFDQKSIAIARDIFEKNCSIPIAEDLLIEPVSEKIVSVEQAAESQDSYRLIILLYITVFFTVNITVLLYFTLKGSSTK